MLELAEETTHKFYMELLSDLEDSNPDKRLKLQDELLTGLTNKNKRQSENDEWSYTPVHNLIL